MTQYDFAKNIVGSRKLIFPSLSGLENHEDAVYMYIHTKLVFFVCGSYITSSFLMHGAGDCIAAFAVENLAYFGKREFAASAKTRPYN